MQCWGMTLNLADKHLDSFLFISFKWSVQLLGNPHVFRHGNDWCGERGKFRRVNLVLRVLRPTIVLTTS